MPDREKHDSKETKIVGRDVPDESKERHTEIAVEAGKHDGPGKGKGSKEKAEKPA